MNSGDTHLSPQAEVHAGVVIRLRPLVVPGTHDLGEIHADFAGWRLVVPEVPAGWLGTLYHGEAPVLTLGVAATAEDEAAIWPGLEVLYLKITDRSAADFAAPHKPPLPWLAVVLVNPWTVPFHWAGDLERCLAWAWLMASTTVKKKK